MDSLPLRNITSSAIHAAPNAGSSSPGSCSSSSIPHTSYPPLQQQLAEIPSETKETQARFQVQTNAQRTQPQPQSQLSTLSYQDLAQPSSRSFSTHSTPLRPVRPRMLFSRPSSARLSRFGGLPQARSRSNSHDYNSPAEGSVYDSNLTWAQRLNMMAQHKAAESQGFIWDSLDNNMEGVQEARQMRKHGLLRHFTNRKDTSYNALRSAIRLQKAEKR
ncbi:hypothetical protein BCR41DRAFT_15135 [Lobosporangium transversale]|uniref:Uncharacterized protein n=1 Tax=Lobosporangium transversale TaxID=64571 RepID=A0A1Y2GTH3_9FUNG|nr:hypothetical protein BCR41DRAFT_15135 [Lobosporangium transversale]ORZ22791.1 hypothetical protein BCR41DRAFT_15135 [Lobosporangium transversale]|eukprot:XP_021883345.1 hypothetical protein BCR41DRAFT_15135 [Lobosporangium transversale]